MRRQSFFAESFQNSEKIKSHDKVEEFKELAFGKGSFLKRLENFIFPEDAFEASTKSSVKRFSL